jgi:hypothetical protein
VRGAAPGLEQAANGASGEMRVRAAASSGGTGSR